MIRRSDQAGGATTVRAELELALAISFEPNAVC
jgi:hypothetical protein